MYAEGGVACLRRLLGESAPGCSVDVDLAGCGLLSPGCMSPCSRMEPMRRGFSVLGLGRGQVEVVRPLASAPLMR
jgi:hypothetical protein